LSCYHRMLPLSLLIPLHLLTLVKLDFPASLYSRNIGGYEEDRELGIQASITIVASAVNHAKALSKPPPRDWETLATMASLLDLGVCTRLIVLYWYKLISSRYYARILQADSESSLWIAKFCNVPRWNYLTMTALYYSNGILQPRQYFIRTTVILPAENPTP